MIAEMTEVREGVDHTTAAVVDRHRRIAAGATLGAIVRRCRGYDDRRGGFDNRRGGYNDGYGGGYDRRGNNRNSRHGYGRQGGGQGRQNELGYHGSLRKNTRIETELFGNIVKTGINFDQYDNIPIEVGGEGCPNQYEYTVEVLGDALHHCLGPVFASNANTSIVFLLAVLTGLNGLCTNR